MECSTFRSTNWPLEIFGVFQLKSALTCHISLRSDKVSITKLIQLYSWLQNTQHADITAKNIFLFQIMQCRRSSQLTCKVFVQPDVTVFTSSRPQGKVIFHRCLSTGGSLSGGSLPLDRDPPLEGDSPGQRPL